MLFLLLLLAATACFAEVPATDNRVYCGQIPNEIYACLDNPRIIKPELSVGCDKSLVECEKMTCVFNNAGWLKDGKVEKQKVAAYFDQFAKDNPNWTRAVEHTKATCLTADLPPQSAALNCPAYDIVMCSFSSFIRNALPAQWSPSKSCDYPKQYAASCPVCPTNCFVPAVPYGSCNACLSLPRTP